jgi:hypothetical protein
VDQHAGPRREGVRLLDGKFLVFARVSEAGPFLPLLSPVDLRRDRPQHLLGNRIFPLGHPWQEQQGLLDVGGQVQEFHDLRHPGLGDVRQAGELGLVGYDPVPEHAVEPDHEVCEWHKACSFASLVT